MVKTGTFPNKFWQLCTYLWILKILRPSHFVNIHNVPFEHNLSCRTACSVKSHTAPSTALIKVHCWRWITLSQGA
jgi:hypothetical protein